ncbi:MAG TPA: hypothetical protein VMM78_20100 [Thermomicrobiales bacterium]|nr:hypothetical protein [Thermomicrobiales bacterium]
MASSIGIADARIGGGAGHFAAASVVVVGATVIVAVAASAVCYRSVQTGVLAMLPAPMVVAAVIGGADRFAAGSLAQGLAIAWLATAALTLLDGVAGDELRSLVAPAGFAIFAIVMAVVARSDAPSQMSATNSALALITTALAGTTLLILPVVAGNVTGVERGMRDAPPR